MHELTPRDTVGVEAVWDTRLTPDGKSYAYVLDTIPVQGLGHGAEVALRVKGSKVKG